MRSPAASRSNNLLSAPGWHDVLSRLTFAHVKTLLLPGNGLGQEAMETLGEIMQEGDIAMLQHLDLSDNPIPDLVTGDRGFR